MKDVKRKHQQKLIEQKIQEEKEQEEQEFISSVMEEKKYDWRKEIEVVKDQVEEVVEDLDDKEYDWREQLENDKKKYFEEGMTSSGVFFTTLNPPENTYDNPIVTIPTSSISYVNATDSNTRLITLGTFDLSSIDQFEVNATRLGSGGASYGWVLQANGTVVAAGGENDPIRVANASQLALFKSGKTTLTIRQSTSSFYGDPANSSSVTGWTISNVKFYRTVPTNVFVSLDSPEASAFIRTDPIMANLSPQERLKKLKNMLEASDEYVAKMLGLDFPGTGAVPPGEYDPFKQAPPGEAGDTPGIEMTDYQNKLAAYEKALAADKQKSDELSKAVAAARAAYLKSGQTVAGRQQSYNNLQAAIKAGTDHALSTLRNPITKPTPPATQTSQSKFTPQQLADIDKQIKDLQAQSEKNKQDAAYKMNMARLNAVIGYGALGAMGGIAGGAAISALGAGGAASAARVATKTGPAAARGFAKANPGKYNPFLSQQANKYFNLKNSYEPQGEVISEKRKLKSPQEVLNRIPGYYDGKPSPLGFPVEPPPKMVNGMHPDLVDGKKVADRFNRLDPESAKAMPPTGNPHIDKKVRAAAKKPK